MSRPQGVIEATRHVGRCVECGDELMGQRTTKRYCSSRCKRLARRPNKLCDCLYCGVAFRPWDDDSQFCSPSCRARGCGPAIGAQNAITLSGGGTCGPWYRDARSGRWIVRGRDGQNYLWYRIVVWNMIGRQLRPDETVHHVNGDCEDDRPENLQVLSRSEHSRLHHIARGFKVKEVSC